MFGTQNREGRRPSFDADLKSSIVCVVGLHLGNPNRKVLVGETQKSFWLVCFPLRVSDMLDRRYCIARTKK